MRVTRSDWRAGGVSPLFSLSRLHLYQQVDTDRAPECEATLFSLSRLHLCQQGAYASRSPSVTCV
jgi:hypothetical protein